MKASGCSFFRVYLFLKALKRASPFLCHCRKENEPKERASQNDASARSVGSYAFVDASHHRKS
jgi:hypothetical protein